uniref:Centrosomal protein of 19 kDa n=1 Tax=Phallusia mammillata TaxID=59560 RepID=A0A6F9D984_9ASCI|nr:centrosomal protein of 19 kDa-like [Phallusia mammillata]
MRRKAETSIIGRNVRGKLVQQVEMSNDASTKFQGRFNVIKEFTAINYIRFSSKHQSGYVPRFAEDMKTNQRHRTLLNEVSLIQIEKMLHIIQAHMKGKALSEAVEYAKQQVTIDPNQDLNKLGEHEVDKAKRIMDEAFESNRIKPDDHDFQYDVQVDFDEVAPVEASGWDSESDNDEF